MVNINWPLLVKWLNSEKKLLIFSQNVPLLAIIAANPPPTEGPKHIGTRSIKYHQSLYPISRAANVINIENNVTMADPIPMANEDLNRCSFQFSCNQFPKPMNNLLIFPSGLNSGTNNSRLNIFLSFVYYFDYWMNMKWELEADCV